MTRLRLAEIVADELATVGQTLPTESLGRTRSTAFAPDLPGFATRTYSAGRSVYIVQARMGGAMRTVTLGSTAVLSLRVARDVARRVLLRAQTGSNPAEDRARVRAAPSWPVFLDEYWRRMASSWKPSTRRSQAIYRRQHLDRAFAGKFVHEISEEDVTRWFAEVTARGGPGAANRTLDILASLFARAEAWGYRAANQNPCRRIRRNRPRTFERFLSNQELGRLGAALNAFEAIDPVRIAALRLILLTGCRKSEILGLRWSSVKGHRLLLEDAKSGPRTVWLGLAARAVIATQPRRSAGDLVFPVETTKPESCLQYLWSKVRDYAHLPGLRIHDLRHSFASHAARENETLPTIARLLGHAGVKTTARYAHLDDRSCIEANERIGELLVAKIGLMLGSALELKCTGQSRLSNADRA